jgi:hypothetical protein
MELLGLPTFSAYLERQLTDPRETGLYGIVRRSITIPGETTGLTLSVRRALAPSGEHYFVTLTPPAAAKLVKRPRMTPPEASPSVEPGDWLADLDARDEARSASELLATYKDSMRAVARETMLMRQRLEEISADLRRTRDDFRNFSAVSPSAILVLDVDLRLRCHSDAAGRLLDLAPGDLGRPLDERFPAALAEAVRDVLRDLERRTIELPLDGRRCLVEINPYRTSENAIDGALLRFTTLDNI